MIKGHSLPTVRKHLAACTTAARCSVQGLVQRPEFNRAAPAAASISKVHRLRLSRSEVASRQEWKALEKELG